MRKVRFSKTGKLTCPFLKLFSNIKEGEARYLHIDRIYYFNDMPFYVMNGQGEIELDKLPHNKPQFNKIDIKNLDYYMQNREHSSLDYDEQAQIQAFCDISFINEAYNKPLLYTQEYKELEKALYGVAEFDKPSIKVY